MRSLRSGPHTSHSLLQVGAVGGGRHGGRSRSHQPGGLRDLVTDLRVQPGPQSVVGVLVGLEPRAGLVLRQVDGGGDLLLPRYIAVRLLTVIGAAVTTDLDLIMGGISWTNGSANNTHSDGATEQRMFFFLTLQRMFTAMESGNLKAWKKA